MLPVTVSIVSHGQGHLVEVLLADLGAHARSCIERIVVTHNIHEDWKAPEEVAGIPVTSIVNDKPQGFGSNHNNAFRLCVSQWFVVMNPDIRLTSNPFPELGQAMSNDRCGLSVPIQVDANGRITDFRRPVPTPISLLRRWVGKLRGVRDDGTPGANPAWAAGSFMFLRERAMREVGGFDTRYRLYCEDVDLCLRLRLNGWTIAVAQQTQVVHDAQRHSRRKLKYFVWHVSSLVRLWTSRSFWAFIRQHSPQD